jgi:diguanylate cyclase (GGDEF)-like protein
MAAALEPGLSTPLEDTMCFHMAAGRGARVCPDLDEDVVYGALPFARQFDAGAYMGVPLELPEGTRFGSLFAMSRGPLGDSAPDLALLDAVAAILGTILLQQTAGMDRGEFLRFLRNLARTDGLTGALNAPGFTEELTREVVRPAARRRGSYVSVQIDDLESLRAKYGRAVADLVLKDVASALAVSTQSPDLVGRVGENRFGVLLVRQPHPDGVPHLLRSLSPRLADSAARREIAMSVRTGSVALAEVDGPGKAWDQAVVRAERLS